MLLRAPVVLLHLSEPLVDKSLGSLGLGDLFWVGTGLEAGHGGNCFRDSSPPLPILPLFAAVTRFPPKVVKNQHFKKATTSIPNKSKGSPAEARKVSRIQNKNT